MLLKLLMLRIGDHTVVCYMVISDLPAPSEILLSLLICSQRGQELGLDSLIL